MKKIKISLVFTLSINLLSYSQISEREVTEYAINNIKEFVEFLSYPTDANIDATIIFYESPNRIERTLKDILAYIGDRPVAIGRELSKKYEEIIKHLISLKMRT